MVQLAKRVVIEALSVWTVVVHLLNQSALHRAQVARTEMDGVAHLFQHALPFVNLQRDPIRPPDLIMENANGFHC